MNDVVALREAASDALARGDQSEANEAYRQELEALQGAQTQPGSHQFAEADLTSQAEADAALASGDVDGAYNSIAGALGWDDSELAQLRSEWGTSRNDLVANVMLGDALLKDHPELEDLAERNGLGNSPAGLIMAAKMARELGYTFTPANQQQTPRQSTQQQPRREATSTMSDTALTQFEDELQSIRGQIVEAQRSGNSKRANRLFAQEQAMIANRMGNRVIVNGRRTA